MTQSIYNTGRKAELAITFFKLLIFIACLSLLVVFMDEVVIRKIATGDDTWLWVCNGVMAVLYLVAGGFFMFWFYAFYKQLYLTSPQVLQIPPLWTVMGFSVPVANLFLPYMLVIKSWRRLKQLNEPAEDFSITAAQTPHYFKLWWFSHLVCFFFVPTALAALAGLQSEARGAAFLGLSVFAYVMVCVSARFAIRLVRELKSIS